MHALALLVGLSLFTNGRKLMRCCHEAAYVYDSFDSIHRLLYLTMDDWTHRFVSL